MLRDRVKETSTTTGTGNFTLAGAATGYRPFSDFSTAQFAYTIAHQTANEFECGIGTLSGGALVRTTVLSNSAGTTANINFSAGTKDVFCSPLAAVLRPLIKTPTKTGAYTALAGDWVLCDANAAAASFAVTLPASPSAGDVVRVTLITDHATRKVTINDNGSNINGGAANDIYYDLLLEGDTVQFEYVGGDTGWAVTIDRLAPQCCKLRRDAAQSVADITDTKIAFDASEFDTASLGDIVTNDRITVRRAGKFHISASGSLAGLTTGTVRSNTIYINGSAARVSGGSIGSLTALHLPVSDDVSLAVGDYIELYFYQDSTGSVNTQTNAWLRPILSVVEVR